MNNNLDIESGGEGPARVNGLNIIKHVGTTLDIADGCSLVVDFAGGGNVTLAGDSNVTLQLIDYADAPSSQTPVGYARLLCGSSEYRIALLPA